MLSSWIEVTTYCKQLFAPIKRRFAPIKPRGEKRKWLKIPVNFIILHYAYLICLTIIGSVILYPVKNIAYIDCLFFGSGAATQSGLNTVDLNKLELYQQIALMLITCLATPIFINTFVVFVRLYWFEKRFQNVVLEAQKYRRTRERTRTMSESKDDDDDDHQRDIVKEEKGVGNRRIIVMHPSDKTMAIAEGRASRNPNHTHHHEDSGTEASSSESRDDVNESSSADTAGAAEHHDPEETLGEIEPVDDGSALPDMDSPASFRRDIMFADEVKPPARRVSDASADRIPAEMGTDHHIAFVENQRNPKDKGTLYIPGPRDFDKGYRPQELDDENAALQRQDTAIESPIMARAHKRYPDSTTSSSRRDSIDNTLKKKIRKRLSFDEATMAFSNARKNLFSKVKFPSETDLEHKSDGPRNEQENKEEEHENPQHSQDPEMPASLRRRGRARTFQSLRSALSNEREEGTQMPYLSYQPTVGRNSAFANLSEEQRDELGGIEYRALKTLAMTLVTFYVGYHLLAVTCLTPWIVYTDRWGKVVDKDGISRTWWGFFTGTSLFNDLGYTLTPDSMISFQYAIFPLLFGSWLIVIGNTGFPCWLRLQIWVASKFAPKKSSLWEEFRFLLDHPRRCFTLLFPSKATWWLLTILVILNGVDLVFFIVLDLKDPILTKIPPGIRVLNGWFQAVSTRTAGFAVVNLSDLHPAIQVSYLVMMYISVFPIAISVRRTNVYEEKSLGIWGEESDDDPNTSSYVGTHLRRQLSFDLWYIFLGLFVICIVEGDRIRNTKDYAFTVFSILFEIVSAYGTVGLSLGYPGTDTSFSAQFKTLSKLVIIAMQLRGRHRGLPYALDKAILLPSEEQQRKENEYTTRRARTTTMTSQSMDRAGLPSTQPALLPRSATGRSVQSTQSSRRKHRLKGLLISGMSAGPSVGKLQDKFA